MTQDLTKRLLYYINTHNNEDTYYDIAKIILKNIHTVPALSISELAELCYVSPSTITRFCKYFNCQNFIDFKNNLRTSSRHIEHTVFHINKDMYGKLIEEPHAFMEHYAQEIASAVRDVSLHMNYEQIDALVKEIHESENVYLFGYSTSLTMIETLQTDLMFANKITYCGASDEVQLDLANHVQKDDLVLIFSSYGNYMSEASHIMNVLLESHAKLVLITQNPHVNNNTMFDEIVFLTEKSSVQAGSYALFIGMEFIVRRYTALYYNKVPHQEK